MIHAFNNRIYAQDLLEKAFEPAMSNETIINLWLGKNAVGNEVLRQWVTVSSNLWMCILNGEHINDTDLKKQASAAGYTWTPADFCQQILGGDQDTSAFTTEAPLIVRIAKFLLRITMVLAVTMVIFNGIMWIIESSKWGEVKDAKKNITLIVVGILIALMSLGIVNLISSITVSSLGSKSTVSSAWCSINGSFLMGDGLKQYICENSTFGTNYTWTRHQDRPINRCERGSKYTSITDTEMVSKCIELGGEYKN